MTTEDILMECIGKWFRAALVYRHLQLPLLICAIGCLCLAAVLFCLRLWHPARGIIPPRAAIVGVASLWCVVAWCICRTIWAVDAVVFGSEEIAESANDVRRARREMVVACAQMSVISFAGCVCATQLLLLAAGHDRVRSSQRE